MKKFLGYLPTILLVFGTVYGFIDPRVYAYVQAHSDLTLILGTLFAASEAIASTDVVKSNSVTATIFDFVDTILARILHKQK